MSSNALSMFKRSNLLPSGCAVGSTFAPAVQLHCMGGTVGLCCGGGAVIVVVCSHHGAYPQLRCCSCLCLLPKKNAHSCRELHGLPLDKIFLCVIMPVSCSYALIVVPWQRNQPSYCHHSHGFNIQQATLPQNALLE